MLFLNILQPYTISLLSVTIVNSTVSKIVKRLWERFIDEQIDKKGVFYIKTCMERGGFVQHQIHKAILCQNVSQVLSQNNR